MMPRRQSRPHVSRQEKINIRRWTWQAQMPALVDEYLKFKHGSKQNVSPPMATVFEISVLGIEGQYIIQLG